MAGRSAARQTRAEIPSVGAKDSIGTFDPGFGFFSRSKRRLRSRATHNRRSDARVPTSREDFIDRKSSKVGFYTRRGSGSPPGPPPRLPTRDATLGRGRDGARVVRPVARGAPRDVARNRSAALVPRAPQHRGSVSAIGGSGLGDRARGARASPRCPRGGARRPARPRPLPASRLRARGRVSTPPGRDASTVTQDIIAGITASRCRTGAYAPWPARAQRGWPPPPPPCHAPSGSRYLRSGARASAPCSRAARWCPRLPLASDLRHGRGVLGLLQRRDLVRWRGDWERRPPPRALTQASSPATWMVFFSQVPAMVGAVATGRGDPATAALAGAVRPQHPAPLRSPRRRSPSCSTARRSQALPRWCAASSAACRSTAWTSKLPGRSPRTCPFQALRALVADELAKALLVQDRDGRDHVPRGRGGVFVLGGNDGESGLEQGLIAQGGEHRVRMAGMNVAGVSRDPPSPSPSGRPARTASPCASSRSCSRAGRAARLPRRGRARRRDPTARPTPVMKPLGTRRSRGGEADCLIAWATVAFTFTAGRRWTSGCTAARRCLLRPGEVLAKAQRRRTRRTKAEGDRERIRPPREAPPRRRSIEIRRDPSRIHRGETRRTSERKWAGWRGAARDAAPRPPA